MHRPWARGHGLTQVEFTSEGASNLALDASVYVGAPRGPLHGGGSTRGAPRGAIHTGSALQGPLHRRFAHMFFYADVRSTLMVLCCISKVCKQECNYHVLARADCEKQHIARTCVSAVRIHGANSSSSADVLCVCVCACVHAFMRSCVCAFMRLSVCAFVRACAFNTCIYFNPCMHVCLCLSLSCLYLFIFFHCDCLPFI